MGYGICDMGYGIWDMGYGKCDMGSGDDQGTGVPLRGKVLACIRRIVEWVRGTARLQLQQPSLDLNHNPTPTPDG